MASVKGVNTTPELVIRKLLHKEGFRYRLHRKELPSKPDIVLPKYRTIILVHGCFWHQHQGCKHSDRPSTSKEYWNKKLDRNIERDRLNISKLQSLGWRVLVIWECQTKDKAFLNNISNLIKNI